MPLASSPADASLYKAGENVEQLGWGVTSTDPAAPINDSLQQAAAVLDSASSCAAADQTNYGDVFDAGDQLCTVPPPNTNQGSCSGDSGGPVVADHGNVWTEIGLTTYGTCDPTTEPDYYTNVAAFARWIKAQLKQMPPPAEWGTYRGKTSQGWRVTLKLSQYDKITDFNFGFTMRCARGRPSYIYEPLDRSYTWSLNTDYGVGFAHTLTDETGTHYKISGVFTSTGQVSGTLSATWRSSQYGYCKTGAVRWSGH
jgi:hypothetical protein